MALVNQDNGGGYGSGGDWWSSNLPNLPSGQFLPGEPTGPATPTTPTPLTGGNEDPSAYFNALFPGDYLDSNMLIAHEADLAAHGIKVLRNAEGRAGKIQLANGQIIDVVQGGGSGLNRKQWLTGDGGGGANGPIPTGDPRYPNDILTPWNEQFKERSPQEIANDPAFQFQMQQGTQAIDRGAAAKGTLLTGGTLKALANYGQGLASTYNDKYFNRDMQQYLLNRENFYNNQDRPFGKLSSLAQLGRPTGGG